MFKKTHTKLRLETCFLKNKTGQFFRVSKEKQDRRDLHTIQNQTRVTTFEFQIMLGPEEKHYSAKVYGVIDAIGTLGGVHEIVLWCVMLIYGSLRKNVYLFSIINRLIQTEQLQDINLQDDREQRDGNQIPTSTHNQVIRQITNRLNNNQTHNYTPIHISEIGIRPGIF